MKNKMVVRCAKKGIHREGILYFHNQILNLECAKVFHTLGIGIDTFKLCFTEAHILAKM